MTREEAISKLNELIECTVDRNMIDDVCYEIIEFLEAQEPRVMTLDEALGGDECWVEYSNGGCGYADCYLSYTTNGADIYRTMQHDFNVPLDTYGKSWRCWSSHPDEKRRAETPWE